MAGEDEPQVSTGDEGAGETRFIPTKPNMGGVEQIGPSSYATWTGGKPNVKRNSLEVPNPSDIEPTQYRPTGVSSAAKSQHYRTTGLAIKFTKDCDLLSFQKDIMDHMVDNGLDTISYLKDPQNPEKMTSVVKDHAKFNYKEIKGAEILQQTLYDKYDLANIRDAKKFLMNSLGPELKKRMNESCNDKDTFIVYWMNLMNMVRPATVGRFEKIKERVKNRKIKDYPGEDVEKIASDFLDDWKELEGAGLYDHNLTYSMVNIIMEGGGSNNEDFRSPLRELKEKLNSAILKIRHKDYAAQNSAMTAQELDVQSVLNIIKEKYLAVQDELKWPASRHAPDSKAIKHGYGASANRTTGPTKEQFDAMCQLTQLMNRDKSKDTCNNCGDVGHWAMDCPKKSKFQPRNREQGRGNTFRGGQARSGRFQSRFGRGGARGGNGGRGSSPRRPSGRSGPFPPPRPGDSEIKTHDGKKFYFCQKCKRWTSTHSTETHRGKSDLSGSSAGMARVNFDLHPAAFRAVVRHGPVHHDHVHDPVRLNPPVTTSPLTWVHLIMLMFMCCMANLIVAHWHQTVAFVLTSFRIGYETVAGNWIIVPLGIGSMITSATTAYLVCTHMVAPEERLLFGKDPRIIPQLNRNRRWHHRPRGRALRPLNGEEVVADMAHHFKSHHRFNHVPRPWRHRPPDQPRIRQLRKQLRQTDDDLFALRKHKDALVDALHPRTTVSCDAWSGSQWGTSSARVFASEGETSKKKTKKAKNPRSTVHRTFTQPDVTKFYHYIPFDEPPMCAQAKYINLSQISSSHDYGSQHDDLPVLFDSGANCCITPCKDDFVGHYTKLTDGPIVDGIGKGLKITGQGTVGWTFVDITGMYRTLKLPCFHVPSSQTRIASIGKIMEAYPDETIHFAGKELIISGNPKTGRGKIRVKYCDQTDLPMGYADTNMPSHEVNSTTHHKPVDRNRNPLEKLPGTASLTEGVNFNLAEPEKEILKWHYRLGHIGMRRIQWLFRQNVLNTSERTRRLQLAASKLSCGPMCTACQYAKQRRKTTPGSVKRTDKNNTGALKVDKMFPGDEVSVDHFFSSAKGRLLHTYGKESEDKKYMGGCIMVDHSSGLIHVELQTHLNSHETLNSKKEFENMCSKHGVVVKEYLSDNGKAFRNAEFTAHLEQFHQTMKHAAVGAHHHNGIAERNIGYVLSIARAMLHHAALHWPDVADVELWPLAVLHAVYVLNRIPREDTGLSPLELFTRKTWPRAKLQELHVWGCPVYVLDGTLSDGKKLPRWQPRSSRSIYMGHSPVHSSAIPLVMNLSTGKLSPQYHVVFDDWFQTVGTSDAEHPNFEHDDWYKTFGLTEWQYIQEEDETGIKIPVMSLPDNHHTPSLVMSNDPSPSMLPSTASTSVDSGPKVGESVPVGATGEVPPGDPVPDEPARATPLPTVPPSPSPIPQVETSLSSPTDASSQREKAASEPVKEENHNVITRPQTRSQTAPTLRRSPRTPKPKAFGLRGPDIEYWESFMANYGTPSPTVNKAKANKDPDLFTWDEAMSSEYKSQFLEAAHAEIESLMQEGTWFEDLRTNATKRIIPCQWVFRIKRSPDGEIKKFKARIVVRGDLQDYSGETYSPVVSWSAVRLALVMCLKLNWNMICIDFSSAFVQSALPDDEPVWMHPPRGFSCSKGSTHVLKLNKSLYGLVQAPRLWGDYISKAFGELGLVQSAHDSCLWYGKDIILVQYVDDCGIGAPNMEIINDFVNKLKKKGLKLTQEGSFTEFLGIKFERNKNKSFKLSQKGLINKILQAASMEDCNPNSLPAHRNALGSDNEGEPYQETWNYRAIVGMLLYLSGNSRPDIALAVSAVARFSNSPKKSHATAVKTILRYLKKTMNDGMTITPTENYKLDLYVDADFCGLFKQEDERDPNVARSRMGYIILLCGCPLIWKTSLMSHITQSTTEAEYSALTTAMRTFLPLKLMVEEMIMKTRNTALEGAMVHATVFEDNQSAFYLATNQRITNRTKYFLAKWHWFWESYKQKLFDIVKCPTQEMLADYFTKSLSKELFEKNRVAVQGW
jgi:hypothetical protein